jgi:RNA polymerase sigma-70 factor, ECF subfamily
MDGIATDAAPATAIVERAATGDTVAFARIVSAYHADLARVAFVVSGGRHDIAEDAVQSAWAKAWTGLGSLRDPDRLKPWLISVAANEARQLCRRERRTRVVEIDVLAGTPTGPDPADRADGLDLERALTRLSADERYLLALRYEAGFDSTEIASVSNRPAATIRWRLARIRSRLRKELSDA